jgi:rhodanese-related sulfurtransferase
MQRFPQSTVLPFLAMAGLAGVAALIANGLAPPARHLAWCGSQAAEPASTLRAEPSPTLNETAPSRPITPSQSSPQDQPDPASRRSGLTPSSPKPQEPVTSSPIREISGEEAWEAFQNGASFLDARRSAEYGEGHIAGAWCAPVWESDLDDRLISFKAARHPGPEDPLVIYCSGGDCRDSHLLAMKLLNEGYFRLLVYRGGFPDWVARSHPVERDRP